MDLGIIIKKVLISVLPVVIVLSARFVCFANPPHETGETKTPEKHHKTVRCAKFFPMTKRKFFIDKSMILQIAQIDDTIIDISNLDEPVGMLILEAIQILDMGDPYRINFKIRRDFDVIYEKYMDFAQIFVALQIPEMTLTKKIPYMSAKTARKRIIPPRSDLYMLRCVEPCQVIRTNYWLKVPIKITLKSDPALTLQEKINWNLALRFAIQLANKKLTDAAAYEQMHNLWAILPSLFPKVELG